MLHLHGERGGLRGQGSLDPVALIVRSFTDGVGRVDPDQCDQRGADDNDNGGTKGVGRANRTAGDGLVQLVGRAQPRGRVAPPPPPPLSAACRGAHEKVPGGRVSDAAAEWKRRRITVWVLKAAGEARQNTTLTFWARRKQRFCGRSRRLCSAGAENIPQEIWLWTFINSW